MRKLLPILVIPVIASCSTMQSSNTKAISEVITADLSRADGAWAGVATISKRRDGIFLSLSGEAPAPGTYGMHIHSVGKCQGPDFTSAGPHWNPGMKQHGRDNPMGAHHGDLPNVVAGPDKKLTLEYKLPDIVLEGGLPARWREVAELYAGCVSGAIQKKVYLDLITAAGFKNIIIQKDKPIIVPDDILANYLSADEIVQYKQGNVKISSITVYAEKPSKDERNCCEPGSGCC